MAPRELVPNPVFQEVLRTKQGDNRVAKRPSWLPQVQERDA
jgi:hypothetical protein